MVSLASGMACSRASTSSRAGSFASGFCCLASFDEDAAAVVKGSLVGDAVLERLKSSGLVEAPGGTGAMAGDVVRVGRRSGSLVILESGDGLVCGWDGAYARCGYDGRAVRSLGGKREAVLPCEAERLMGLVV